MSKMDLSGLKSRCQPGCVSFMGARKEFVSLIFPTSRGSSHSLAHSLFYFYKASSVDSSNPFDSNSSASLSFIRTM